MAKEIEYELSDDKRARYPWDKWTNGKTWLLVRGEDYVVTTRSMRNAVYSHARNHGLNVSTETPSPDQIELMLGNTGMQAQMNQMTNPKEGLVVQFFPGQEEDSSPKLVKKVRKPLRRKSAK